MSLQIRMQMLAAEHDVEAARLLLSHGFSPEPFGQEGASPLRTPLCVAYQSGHLELVEVLVAAGAAASLGRPTCHLPLRGYWWQPSRADLRATDTEEAAPATW